MEAAGVGAMDKRSNQGALRIEQAQVDE